MNSFRSRTRTRPKTLIAFGALVVGWGAACSEDPTNSSPNGLSCTNHGQCATREICQAGRCVAAPINDAAADLAGCTGNSQCATGEICQAGRCVAAPINDAAADQAGKPKDAALQIHAASGKNTLTKWSGRPSGLCDFFSGSGTLLQTEAAMTRRRPSRSATEAFARAPSTEAAWWIGEGPTRADSDS